MSNWVSINNILVTIDGYPLSYVEFIGTVTGLFSVWFAARSNILTWPVGLINVSCFFIIFFQVNLYSDMFLQAYFFVVSIYGWAIWAKKTNDHEQIVERLSKSQRLLWGIIILVLTIVIGVFVKNINLFIPAIFSKPASYPFLDTFVAVMSIVATILLAQKKLENWPLWITIDVISIGLYAQKHVLSIAIEYGIFLCLATWGFVSWIKNEKRVSSR